MSGLSIKKLPVDQTRFFISDVRENSPGARSGALPLDEIIAINKVPVFIWELVEINKLLRSEEGRIIELELRRYDSANYKKWEKA